MKYGKIREEELKNRVASEWFAAYDSHDIIGNIDFAIADRQDFSGERFYYLWAEAKRGQSNIYHSLVQLILTIGRARTFDTHTPPLFLGAFDAERIAFVPYSEVLNIFYQNDFNWLVTPSDHSTREFQQVLTAVTEILELNTLLFAYHQDDKELRRFISRNFVQGSREMSRIRISKSNFISVYNKWVEAVAPTIDIHWDEVKPHIIMADFYLADLLSRDSYSIKDKLNVVLKHKYYELNKTRKANGLFSIDVVNFRDGGRVYNEFWQRYERPPRREYWDYIIDRRDLLVPQDVRERKGSYFTPRIWVEKSQEYLALEFGEDWQDHYYVWDCAAGTGNLLVGLSNKYNIWASTLDVADVKVMHERIANGANLLESHVFQFDFLNDSFDDPKLPDSLRRILQDPEERKKLIIYINPPYAEAGNARQRTGTGVNKTKTAKDNAVYERYRAELGPGAAELFAQFLIRIYHELPLCKIAEFSTLKTLQAPNFRKFRKAFRAKLGRIFCVPANTFDNVKGKFPIGFKIWDCEKEEVFTQIQSPFFNSKNEFLFFKGLYAHDNAKMIGTWLSGHKDKKSKGIGMMNSGRNDFQNQNLINIQHHIGDDSHALTLTLTLTNIQIGAIFFAVRWCITADWHNDRDQFLYPSDGWERDTEFQNDCLAYTLFHGQNRITSTEGINHWIPFTEEEVAAPERFTSHWMTDYIKGKLRPSRELEKGVEAASKMFDEETEQTEQALNFSPEATAVFDAGRALWRYYMAQEGANANASLYDIRGHFQGFAPDRQGKPKMNSKSDDERYTQLIAALRKALQHLAEYKIQPKVYEYGFLRR